MKFRTRVSQRHSGDLGTRAKHGFVGGQYRSAECYFPIDAICRRLKIRVIASPQLTAARCPQIFAAGFSFNGTVEPARSLGRTMVSTQQPIDWRISGEQDAASEE